MSEYTLPEVGMSIRTGTGRQSYRITYRPDWSKQYPFATYYNGTALGGRATESEAKRRLNPSGRAKWSEWK